MRGEFNTHLFESAWFRKFAPKEEADCQRIAAVAKKHFGIDMLLIQAKLLWRDYSEENSASWLILPDDDAEIAQIINAFVKADMGDELIPVGVPPELAREYANERLKTRCDRMLRLLHSPRMPPVVIEAEVKLLHEALLLGYTDVLTDKPPASESWDG